jgi:hypothetical protein
LAPKFCCPAGLSQPKMTSHGCARLGSNRSIPTLQSELRWLFSGSCWLISIRLTDKLETHLIIRVIICVFSIKIKFLLTFKYLENFQFFIKCPSSTFKSFVVVFAGFFQEPLLCYDSNRNNALEGNTRSFFVII